ncbi:MAG: hypothetical protein KY468_12995, partial [Armatimonadetes bacterium]|nr:hypothetical protein [Armatimonadota bacterium]
NLDTLQYIAQEVARRGLHFQLGLWTHGYDWSANEGVNHFIEGLNPENHAAYCRDTLRLLLEAVPEIGGVTFRIHGESGVPEGTYAFWRTVFRGIAGCGRAVEIDMHAKGIDPEMIDVALETGMPVNVSPKYSAEHMMLPYQQASIRASEMPPEDRDDEGFFAKSGGSRRFLRYSYGDLLKEDRRYGVLFRMWPGTQRLLLWGDPEMAAAYSRAAGFCGSAGMELCEPLSFKGRKGSGHPWGREAYADESLKSAEGDWKKYEYSYRLWGQLLYDPEAPSDSWRRYLKREFGPGGRAVETALGAASHILPLVTTAHHPSAANNNYWPEIYTNMSIVDEDVPHPYGDTPRPKRFGRVSPLDPELFAGVDEAAAELLSGEPSGKVTPMEVAAWLERFADRAMNSLSDAKGRVADPEAPEFRRLSVDVAIQAGLGRFFAYKMRAGVLYAIFDRSGQRKALEAALEQYHAARAAWAELSECAEGVYVSDITFGWAKHSRGHWADRLPAIDEDLAAMERRLESRDKRTEAGEADARPDPKQAERAIRAALKVPSRPHPHWDHTPPDSFRRGHPVKIEAALGLPEPAGPFTVELRYRHANQGERYRTTEMVRAGGRFHTFIPGDDTDSPYPLMYYFIFRDSRGRAALCPGFNERLTNTPYYLARQE